MKKGSRAGLEAGGARKAQRIHYYDIGNSLFTVEYGMPKTRWESEAANLVCSRFPVDSPQMDLLELGFGQIVKEAYGR